MRTLSTSLLAILFSVMALGAAQGDEHTLSEDLKKLYDEAVKCQKLCLMCADSCLDEVAEGETDHKHCLKMCQDCALICGVTAQIAAQDGPLIKVIAAACAVACEKCAEECEKHDEEIHKKCAEQCRKCAEICRQVAHE